MIDFEREEENHRFELAYLQAEKDSNYDRLKHDLTRNVVKLSRKEAKNRYLYKRLNHGFKLV